LIYANWYCAWLCVRECAWMCNRNYKIMKWMNSKILWKALLGFDSNVIQRIDWGVRMHENLNEMIYVNLNCVRECAWVCVSVCECMWIKVCEKRFIKKILWYLGGKGYFDEFVSWDEYEKIHSKKLSFWIYALRLLRKRFIKSI
jgi:hypothetical protein